MEIDTRGGRDSHEHDTPSEHPQCHSATDVQLAVLYTDSSLVTLPAHSNIGIVPCAWSGAHALWWSLTRTAFCTIISRGCLLEETPRTVLLRLYQSLIAAFRVRCRISPRSYSRCEVLLPISRVA